MSYLQAELWEGTQMVHTEQGTRCHEPWCKYVAGKDVIAGTGGLRPCQHCCRGQLAEGVKAADLVDDFPQAAVRQRSNSSNDSHIPTIRETISEMVGHVVGSIVAHLPFLHRMRAEEEQERQKEYDAWLLGLAQEAQSCPPLIEEGTTIADVRRMSREDQIRAEYQILSRLSGATPNQLVRRMKSHAMQRELHAPVLRDIAGQCVAIPYAEGTDFDSLSDAEKFVLCFLRPDCKGMSEYEIQIIMNEHARILADCYNSGKLHGTTITQIQETLRNTGFVNMAWFYREGLDNTVAVTRGIDERPSKQPQIFIWDACRQPMCRLMHETLHALSKVDDGPSASPRFRYGNGFCRVSSLPLMPKKVLRRGFTEACTEYLMSYMLADTIYRGAYHSGYEEEMHVIRHIMLPIQDQQHLLDLYLAGDYLAFRELFQKNTRNTIDLDEVATLMDTMAEYQHAFKVRNAKRRLRMILAQCQAFRKDL